MNKLRKKQIKVAATAFIALTGGLTIWSCSQDELDDFGQPIYRYTAEEIATLNSLADEYGLKDVRFITESDTPLPPLKEMKDLFKEFASIQASLSTPLEVTDSTENSISFSNQVRPFKRIKGISETLTEERKITYGTLVWTIYWQQSVYDDGVYQCPVVDATTRINFSTEYLLGEYHSYDHCNFCSIRGSELYITFTCRIGVSNTASFEFEYSDWVHPGFRPYR